MAPVRSVGREDGFHGWGPASVGPVRGEGAPLAPSPAAAGLAAPRRRAALWPGVGKAGPLKQRTERDAGRWEGEGIPSASVIPRVLEVAWRKAKKLFCLALSLPLPGCGRG